MTYNVSSGMPKLYCTVPSVEIDIQTSSYPSHPYTNAHDTLTRNCRRKAEPENRYWFLTRLTCNLVTNFSGMSNEQNVCYFRAVYGTSILVGVFGTDF